MTAPRHSVSVAGIVTDDAGRVLVIRRRDSGDWQPPGGVLELGETIHDGLRREVLEETGILVEPERLTGVYKHLTLGVVALVFRCRCIAGTAVPTAESAEVRWITTDEVTARMVPAFAVRITDALSGISVSIRHHDGTNLLDRNEEGGLTD